MPMFTRDQIASKVKFELYRSAAVEGINGSFVESTSKIGDLYGSLRSRNFGRQLQDGQLNEQVTHEFLVDYTAEAPRTGDELRRGTQRWQVHATENEGQFNVKMKVLISRVTKHA